MESKSTTTTQDHLAEQFRFRILSGQFAPGQRLREAPLAQQFGVSRGPVRDTFVRLTREGLLEATPNVGVRVAQPPSSFKRRTLVKLRRTLECQALSHWFRDASAPLLTALRGNLTAYRKACRRESLSEVVALDMAFHRTLVTSADDGSLLDLWMPVISQMYLRYSRHASLMESYAEHAAIVQAMQAGDRPGALRHLREHIV